MAKEKNDEIQAQIDKAKMVGYDLHIKMENLFKAKADIEQQFAQNRQEIAQLESKLKE